MLFAAARRYRFFSRVATESGNARASHTLRFVEDTAVEIAAAGERAFGGVLGFVGRHTEPAAIHTSRGLLLPLFASEEPGKLREDVRATEICVALVGDVLREVAKPLQRRKSGRRAAHAAQGSRRARAALIQFREGSPMRPSKFWKRGSSRSGSTNGRLGRSLTLASCWSIAFSSHSSARSLSPRAQ